MTINDAHCLAIGRITVAFSELDSWLNSFIWALICPFEDQHIGQIITAEVSFSKKIDLLTALFKYRCKDTAKQKQLKDLLARVAKLEQERNAVQHSLWLHQSENMEEVTRLKITAKRRHGLHHTKEIVTAKPLEDIVKELQTATSELASFHVDFSIALDEQNSKFKSHS